MSNPPSRVARNVLSLALLGFPLVVGRPLAAQGAPGAPVVATDSAAQAPSSAPVLFNGDTLFVLHGRLGAFTPAARAAAVADRLQRLAVRVADGDSVLVADSESMSEISIGDEVVMTVLEADAQPTGIARGALARQYAQLLQTRLTASAKSKSVKSLLIDTGLAVLATGVLILTLWLFTLVFPRLYGRLDAMGLQSLPSVRIQNLELLSAKRIHATIKWLARAARGVATVLVFYIYIPLVLSFFPWTAPFSRRIVGLALRPFGNAWTSFIEYLPNLFYLAAGIIIVRYFLKLLHMVAEAVRSGAITLSGFYPEWVEPTYKIVRVLVFAFAAIVLYPYLPGSDSDAFKGVSLFFGVLFSLGSSGAVGNMVAGIVLTYTRAFQVGDRVKIGETTGDVIERTLLITRLRTIKNVAITIPNGSVLSGQIVNYTAMAKTSGLILNTSVTIGYDVPWKQVHEMLITAAERTEHILKDPKPFVLQTSLDDFYVAYQVNAYTDR
ncbi:MAG: mechanosensitive ion channel family protein, partial [Gemmatimonadota bacterium]|nr:mechanosensitive ion channel family protein [Gemmatimonadota bacterium]